MNTENKPHIWKSVLCTIPCGMAYISIYFLSFVLTAVILYIALHIPLIKNILTIIFNQRGDTPDIFAFTLSALVSYRLTTILQKKLMKDYQTIKLSRIILGVTMTTVSTLWLIINISTDGEIVPNIIGIIVGLVFILSRQDIT